MRLVIAALTCALVGMTSGAEPITVKGLVRDSATQKAIAGAIVRLKINRLTDTTDASGAFTLGGAATVRTAIGAQDGARGAGFTAGGAIRLVLARPGRVAVRGCSIDGRQSFCGERLLPAGEHVWECVDAGHGTVIWRVTTEAKEYTLRQARMGLSATTGAAGTSGSASAGLPKAPAGFSDTLEVTRSGYLVKRMALSSAIDTGLVIPMTADDGTTVTDVEGNVYKTVRIGTQVWMQENLRVTKYRDGTPVPYVNNKSDWNALKMNPAYCWYDDKPANKVWGGLYNWSVVDPANPKKIAPEGWHVPSQSEWNTLVTFLGGESVAGGKMKEAGSVHWNQQNVGATNSSGFTGLPSGYRQKGSGDFFHLHEDAFYRGSTSTGPDDAYVFVLFMFSEFAQQNTNYYGKSAAISIRCVRD